MFGRHRLRCAAEEQRLHPERQPGDLVASICFGSHVSSADTLTLLIKASATVAVYRGHRRTLLPAWVNSLFITCIGIVRNNSFVCGRVRAESNPGHWARHALLNMAAVWVNHSATKASLHEGRVLQQFIWSHVTVLSVNLISAMVICSDILVS